MVALHAWLGAHLAAEFDKKSASASGSERSRCCGTSRSASRL